MVDDDARHDDGDRDEQQRYVDEMVRRRGYVLDYHRVMAAHDLPVLKAANELVSAAYLEERSLDRRTKELLFVLSLTVVRAERHHIASHIRVALQHGATPQEILEAIEIALPQAGVVAFQHGFDVWREVVGAEGIEPSPDVLPHPETRN
ncbi:carboxymuconolactone decarboxylase family protein [Phytoactinopolyspora mesophila]|uniref:Carboxymuconolactone decarboxylase family protein n=1 Tax=Phytoactinopolyspora mesophila TaxID=2650750 RepID=A0A7K3MB14_9ACTN|nr:carboxymuconolactone decarboxylase family protein [Phytoactinopolyspora mesophila]NDL60360.1 carboxymuconolactone decarboxylase family protein [Phytoactinopolyspora mesophila]